MLCYVVMPTICLAMGSTIYLEMSAKHNIQLVIVGCQSLVFLSIVIFVICTTLTCHYQRSTEDPRTQPGFKFVARLLYTSSLLA
ncbi:hypothetical protein HanIR_Chr05g0255551 [Helianthus annuus]|nr:hypothetical protein HanIR_Chr05g0255551 [Helianthus annuus]